MAKNKAKGQRADDQPSEEGPAARPTLKNKVYLAELDRLQLELSKLQEWVKASGAKVE